MATVDRGPSPEPVPGGLRSILRYRAELGDVGSITTAPHFALRGHQLGYRPKTHSYDAWDLTQWEQYYRDLSVFGANAIELIPPRSDDAADSPERAIRLMAGEFHVIHPFQPRTYPYHPQEYDIPAEAFRHGELTLTWTLEPGLGRNGRGCQVAEIWLLQR